jgi:hypothetical protein
MNVQEVHAIPNQDVLRLPFAAMIMMPVLMILAILKLAVPTA